MQHTHQTRTKEEPFDDRTFRDVLGHLPSGVVAITGRSKAGEPAGMVVGTFASVSLTPPLVAFFVDRGSSSFPRMRDAGVFCANILSAHQEPLCRKMSSRGGNKFEGVEWQPAGSGSPILDGAVAWVDCAIDSISEAGDHLIVIGRVRDLGVSTPTIPLLFFQGGFGGFAPGSLAAETYDDLFGTLRTVERVRAGMEELAVDVDADCIAHAVSGGYIRVVAAAYAPRGSTTYPRVGFQIPLIPPWAEPFLAWSSPGDYAKWVEELRADKHGRYDVDTVRSNIQQIRDAGWAYTVRTETVEGDGTLEELVKYGYTPAIERSLGDLIRSRGDHGDPAALDQLPPGAVRTIFAPVLDGDGRLILMLALHNLAADLSPRDTRQSLQRLLSLARSASLVAGG